MDAVLEAVAIDGPAGAGKSSVARRVATERNYLYVDTGAMYRAVALGAMRLGVELDDPRAMTETARNAKLAFDSSGTKILLDGEDVSRDIRSPEVAANVKFAARVPEVRALLVAMQQGFARTRPVVMEGRDICTVVLPAARWKFFLTASVESRAERRHAEMRAAGRDVDLDGIRRDIVLRDEADYQVGPMKEARERALRGDGIAYLDTSDMTPDEVVMAILAVMARDSGS